jgi:hypothetical protein
MGVIYAHCAFAFSLLFAVAEAINHRDHAKIAATASVAAKVERIWRVPARGGDRLLVRIGYKRETPNGWVDCSVDVHLHGRLAHIVPGETVPVIPRSYSCYEPLLVEPRGSSSVMASVAGFFFLTSLFLIFAHVQHHRGDHAFGRETM